MRPKPTTLFGHTPYVKPVTAAGGASGLARSPDRPRSLLVLSRGEGPARTRTRTLLPRPAPARVRALPRPATPAARLG